MYFLDKNLIRCQNRKYRCFRFRYQFRVWYLCWSLFSVLSFVEKKTKIIAEIDLIIRNYESRTTDNCNKHLHSEKKKKHKEKNMNGTNTT